MRKEAPKEHTVFSLSRLAGVSPRTLRHYDALGLLRPAGTRPSGYRVYGPAEVQRLQRILLFRELGLPLDAIRRLLDEPGRDALAELREHRAALLLRKERIDALVDLVDRTIAEKEGRATMTDKERFEAFKKGLVAENEAKHGAEARAAYGDEAVDASNAKVLAMDEKELRRSQDLGEEVVRRFVEAFDSGDPTGPLAREAAALHREWLKVYWARYTPEAHAGLVRMYVDDPRFTAFYDRHRPGLAVFLRDAVLSWLGA